MIWFLDDSAFTFTAFTLSLLDSERVTGTYINQYQLGESSPYSRTEADRFNKSSKYILGRSWCNAAAELACLCQPLSAVGGEKHKMLGSIGEDQTFAKIRHLSFPNKSRNEMNSTSASSRKL